MLPWPSPKYATDNLQDVSGGVSVENSLVLPFNARQVVDNVRFERYHSPATGLPSLNSAGIIRNLYYLIRPLLAVPARRHLQKFFFRRWRDIPFPSWPVDGTVDELLQRILVLSMKAQGLERVPFIWFWPKGMPSCTMITHDVETAAGVEFCPTLMDINDSFGIKTSFQIVPEKRYPVTSSFLDNIRNRGFEINVHDLNHDGCLWTDRDEFLRRAVQINRYGREFGAPGFRSAVMYRNTDWMMPWIFHSTCRFPTWRTLIRSGEALYGHALLRRQDRGFPLTTTQDYPLFNIIGDYPVKIWEQQMSLIRHWHGLMSFIIHPDYVIDAAARGVYLELLRRLSDLRRQGETWIAKPNDIATWWRMRSELNLVRAGGSWRIEGAGSEQASVAFAVLEQDRLVYQVDRQAGNCSAPMYL